jgi:hypothetical protein
MLANRAGVTRDLDRRWTRCRASDLESAKVERHHKSKIEGRRRSTPAHAEDRPHVLTRLVALTSATAPILGSWW